MNNALLTELLVISHLLNNHSEFDNKILQNYKHMCLITGVYGMCVRVCTLNDYVMTYSVHTVIVIVHAHM